MSNAIELIDDLVEIFGKKEQMASLSCTTNNKKIVNTKNTKNVNKSTAVTNEKQQCKSSLKSDVNKCNKKKKNGIIDHKKSNIVSESVATIKTKNNVNTSSATKPITIEPKKSSVIKSSEKPTTSSISNNINNNYDNKYDDDKKEIESDEKDLDDLSEEEALRLAMAMSMNDEDRKLVENINKEIKEAQAHLSNWFSGNFPTVRDKNRAWCDFCRRLHHKFEMYRIENGIIQPLSYQFFIQFIALMYNSMPKKNHKRKKPNSDLSIDQHKIKEITILSADDMAISYLRFKDNINKNTLKDAVYVKFESLALDPMSPSEWKWNHVMFIKSKKAPNGLLWTKWHMQ